MFGSPKGRRHRARGWQKRKRPSFGFTMAISEGAYRKAKAKVAASNRKRRGRRAMPASWKDPATNRDRSVVEVYEFRHRKKASPFTAYLKGQKVTNWTGLRLCDVTKRTSGRSGFIDVTGRRPERVTVHARCIDGRQYVGRGPGDGMYLNLRPKK